MNILDEICTVYIYMLDIYKINNILLKIIIYKELTKVNKYF